MKDEKLAKHLAGESGVTTRERSAKNTGEFLDNGSRNPNELAESAYRRGFQQGAQACLEVATALGLKPSLLEIWVGTKLHDWRFNQLTKSRNKRPPVAPMPLTKSEYADQIAREIAHGRRRAL